MLYFVCNPVAHTILQVQEAKETKMEVKTLAVTKRQQKEEITARVARKRRQ